MSQFIEIQWVTFASRNPDKGRQGACRDAGGTEKQMNTNLQNQPANFVMLPAEEWQKMLEKQERLEALILNRNKEDVLAEWIESEEARKMLGVCSRTWQSMRDRRQIPFSQFGRKVWVRRSDVEKFMKSNLIKK